MLPLIYAKTGDVVNIKRVLGKDSVKKHLSEMGFVEGSVVRVVSSHNGDLILNVKESRIALTKEMAEKIMMDIEDEKKFAKNKI